MLVMDGGLGSGVEMGLECLRKTDTSVQINDLDGLMQYFNFTDPIRRDNNQGVILSD